ncbi:MAG: hypothetical protein DCC58_13740 [Chloroflexi bacterium]|nr:MAG: hypothetical protein DCC58_13740 [Chloroflexota bacterium]
MYLSEEGGLAPAKLLRAGLSRRSFLRWTALAGSLAAIAPILAACGGDDDDEPTAVPPTATAAAAEPTATTGGGTSEPTATSAPPPPTATIPTVEGSGGSIITVHSNDADSLDPQRTVLGDSWVIFRSIYDTLIAKNPALEFEPLIAESWEVSDDGLEYTYAIRSGLKFHDGSDVTAEDVKFTFDRASNPDAPSQALSFIDAYDHAELVDANTVKLFLKNPSAPFTSNIAVEYFGILPQAAVEAAGDDFGTQPVGSGPWMFKEWIQGEQCTLVPFPDYVQYRTFIENKGAPKADELVFRVITEAQTQIAALQTGEINHIQILPNHEYKNFKDDPEYVVLVVEGSTSIVAVEFVTEGPPADAPGDPIFKAPFDDVRVRQAVAHAINADEIIEAVLEGLAKRNYGPMPTGLFAWDPAIEEYGYHYDPEKAAALLDEAGWTLGSDGVREKDGQKMDLTYWMWTGATEERASQVIQNQLGEVGIKINLESLDIGTMVARLPEAVHHLNWMEVGWPEADILYILTSFGWGVGRYQSPDYMELLTLARETVDLDERRKYYFEAQKLFLEVLPWVPLWSPMGVTATRAELKNFKLGADGTFLWEDAFVES